MIFFNRKKPSASARSKKTLPAVQERVLTAEGWKRRSVKPIKKA